MIIEATKFNYAIPKTKLKAYRYNLSKVSIQQQVQLKGFISLNYN